jgi:hypothetical protein
VNGDHKTGVLIVAIIAAMIVSIYSVYSYTFSLQVEDLAANGQTEALELMFSGAQSDDSVIIKNSK